MTEKTESPFAGLDSALLRSTQDTAEPPSQDTSRDTAKKAAPSRRRRRTKNPRDTQDSKHASDQASTLASQHDDVIEAIRKIVKTPGKEVSFVRLTPEEKSRLADIVYTYKRQGKKTSENEVNRIAVNFILEDYDANGENSILANVIDALLA